MLILPLHMTTPSLSTPSQHLCVISFTAHLGLEILPEKQNPQHCQQGNYLLTCLLPSSVGSNPFSSISNPSLPPLIHILIPCLSLCFHICLLCYYVSYLAIYLPSYLCLSICLPVCLSGPFLFIPGYLSAHLSVSWPFSIPPYPSAYLSPFHCTF